jgi:hypothetical protein
MNQNEILKMAREAGAFWELSETPEKDAVFLMRFAERVAAYERERMEFDGIHTCHDKCQRPACVAVREAVKAEREACAQLCDEYVVPVSIEGAHPDYLIGKQMAFQQAARAIRERGEK